MEEMTPTPQPDGAAGSPTPEPVPPQPWYQDTLSTEFQSNPTIQKYESPDEFAKAHLNLVEKLGNDKIPLPKEGASDGEWDSVFEKLGMPTDGKYGLELKELPEEFGDQGQAVSEFEKVARDIRLTKEQAQKLYEWDHNRQMGQYDGMAKSVLDSQHEAEVELRNEWGLKFNENLDKANRASLELFGEEGFEKIKQSVGNNPAFIKGMSKYAESLSEDGIGKFSQTGFTKSPGEAKMEYDKIMANSHDPYWGNKDKDGNQIPHAIHRERVSYVEGLVRQMNSK